MRGGKDEREASMTRSFPSSDVALSSYIQVLKLESVDCFNFKLRVPVASAD